MRLNLKLLLAAIVGVLLIALSVSVSKLSESRKTQKRLLANEKAYRDTVRVYKDKDGKSLYQRYAFQRTIDELKDSESKKDRQILEMAKRLKIKPSDIIVASVVEEKVDTVVKVVNQPKDSCYTFRVNDEFISTVCVRKDSVSYRPQISNTQSLIVSSNRETVRPRSKVFFIRWFQKKHTVVKVSVKNSNSAIKVNDITTTYTI